MFRDAISDAVLSGDVQPIATAAPCNHDRSIAAVAIRRPKAMVPLTDVRIEYSIRGQRRETRVDTVIVNREQIDWVEAVIPSQVEFPEGPGRLVVRPARHMPARC